LATAESAGTFSIHIDQCYSYCGFIENDFHLFFQCNLVKQVWRMSNPSINTEGFQPEEDGIQLTLPLIIPNNADDEMLTHIILLLWYIWKARNDNRFNDKTWTAWSVHQAVKSHAYVHLQTHSQIQLHGNHLGNTSNAGTQVQQIQSPQDLQGITCYVDASTKPDSLSHNIHPACLGIVIVHTQVQPASKIHIKAVLNDTSSVIMAEAAAISLAAKILIAL